jgi:hypothetical protein
MAREAHVEDLGVADWALRTVELGVDVMGPGVFDLSGPELLEVRRFLDRW